MKADFQMTELKLKYAKWQYDVNKGNKRPVRSPNRNPALNLSSENVLLPNIPENMAVRRRGEGSPNIAQQINLTSFGNDGRRRDASGHHRVVNQRILSSPGMPGGQIPHPLTSQSHDPRSSSSLLGSEGQVFTSSKTNQPLVATQSLPPNNNGLEALELKLRNMNKPVEKQRSAPPRTLVAPLKPFAGDYQESQRNMQPPQIVRGSVGMESHNYQMDQQRRAERSITQNTPSSHSVPGSRTIVQVTKAAPLKTYADNWQQPQRIRGSGGVEPHGYSRGNQQSFERYGTSNSQTSQGLQYDHQRGFARSGIPIMQTSHRHQTDDQHRSQRSESSNIQTSHVNRRDVQGIFESSRSSNTQTSHGYEMNNQRRTERSGFSNLQTHQGYQRDHQHRTTNSGTLNIQTYHTAPNTRTVLQDDIIVRTNQDLTKLTNDRDKLLNELGDILIEQGVVQQDEMEDAMSSGDVSDGSGYDLEDAWDMETSESPIETNDVGTQFSYPREEGSSLGTLEFQPIDSSQGESRYFIEGSSESFPSSSELTYDVCIQVSVRTLDRTMSKTTSNGSNGAFQTQDDMNKNELNSVDRIDTLADKRLDNSEVLEIMPSVTPPEESGETCEEKHPSGEAVEDLVLPVNHPNDLAQFSVVLGPHRDNELKKLTQEMNNYNITLKVEPQEQAPDMLSHMEETSVNSKSDTSKIVVEEFVPRLKGSQCSVHSGLAVVHHDGALENLAQEMDKCKTTVSVDERETPEALSQMDGALMNSQSDTSRVVVEECVPCLKGSHDNAEFSATDTHHDGVLEKLAQQMDNCKTVITVEQLEQTSETSSHVDETLTSRRDSDNRIVEEFVPRVRVSQDNSEFVTMGARNDDVFEKLEKEMDSDNISDRTEGNELLLSIDLHISADNIKSEHAEPQEQSRDTSSPVDQRPTNSQSDAEKTTAEESVPHLNLPADSVQCSVVSEQREDGLERQTKEIEKCSHTENVDKNELNSTGDLQAESQPLVCEVHTTEEVTLEDVKHEQGDLLKETCLDQRPSETSKEVFEKVIPHRKLSRDKAQLNTDNAQHDNALEKLAEEMEKTSNPIVSPEQERIPLASGKSNIHDDKRLVTDNFCEVLAENNPSFDLVKLSSPVGGNEVFQTKISVGHPNVETFHISSSKTDWCYGSDSSSRDREGWKDEFEEIERRIMEDSEVIISPTSYSTAEQLPKTEIEFDSPQLLKQVEDDNNLTKEKGISSQDTFRVTAVSKDDKENSDTAHQNLDDLRIFLDVTEELSTPFENELTIDKISEDRRDVEKKDIVTNQTSPKDTVSRGSGVQGTLCPKRSKIPVPKSRLTRSKSCPARNRSNGKVKKQNSQSPKEASLKSESVDDKASRVDISSTPPAFANPFPLRNERSRWSFKGDKQTRSHIPVPSRFKRTGSCPNRTRPVIRGIDGKSASDSSNGTANPPSQSTGNILKTRSRDIDIIEALAVPSKDDRMGAATTDVSSAAQSTLEADSMTSDLSDALIIRDEIPNPNVEDDKQLSSSAPSETDKFIQKARQILSKIPVPPTNASQTESVPVHINPSTEDNQHFKEESKEVTRPEEVSKEDNHDLQLSGRGMNLLLEAELSEDDTASETLTLHSENDFDIQSPLHDEVLRISETELKLSTSRIPVPRGSHKPSHNHAPIVQRDFIDEVFNEISGKERSVARISPMPREVEDELTPTPTLRKSCKSRIPVPTSRAIQQTSVMKRSRSYSEADGENAMIPDDLSEKLRHEEPEDTDDESVIDHLSEPDWEHTPFTRSHSSREVRPRGSYWAFSTSPSLATTEFERSQTLRVNRSKNSGIKSPGGTTPRTTPRVTPRATPKATPRATPRVSPRGTPISTPRDIPSTPRGGSLRRQHPGSKTLPTFKSRECAFVPLPEWNRLREVLASGEQSKKISTCPSSPSEYSYTSRRSSEEFQGIPSPKWDKPVTTPKPSRWRVDGRVPPHLKKKYSSLSNMDDTKDLYQSDQDFGEPGAVKRETDSPWMIQSPIRASSSSQSVPHADRYAAVKDRRADALGERSLSSASRGRPPSAAETVSDVLPKSSVEDVSTIWTEDDTLESSNFSLPAGEKKKSWKRRFSLRRKKSADTSKVDDKGSDEVKQKKKRKNWLLRFLGIKK